MKTLVQAVSVIAFTVVSASVGAWQGAPCMTEEQHQAMVEQQQAAAKQFQAQFQAMAEQRAKAMETMMQSRRALPMDRAFGQARPMPDFPAMPERPRFGAMPQMPEMPEMPAFPPMPEAPRFGAMPQMPEMPEMPAFPPMPEAPRFGAMPQMPEMPPMPAGFERRAMPSAPPALGQRAKDLEAHRAQRAEEAKVRHDKAMAEREARRQELAQRISARRYNGPAPMWMGPVEAPVAPAAGQAPTAAPTAN